MRNYFFLLSILGAGICPYQVLAQAATAPLWDGYYHLLDRYEIKSGHMQPAYFSSFKPVRRDQVAVFVDSLDRQGTFESPADRFNLSYLRQDNWEFFADSTQKAPPLKRRILRYFYRTPSDAIYAKDKGAGIHISPVFHFDAGHDTQGTGISFINTRGIVARGNFDNKLGFYTYLTENQVIFSPYVQQWTDRWHVVPGEGFWKRYGKNGVDFITVNGYLTFKAGKRIGLQAGHDKMFVGNGMRSILFSDFANNYYFFRINARIWHFHYTNVIARLKADLFYYADGLLGTREFPNKNLVMHQLNWQVTSNLNFGLFEAVMFSSEDSLRTGSFDVNYLNPLIFYRGLEQQLGSPDNVLVGLDGKWNFAGHFSAYCQFLLDELSFSDLKNGTGWWSNKYAYQLGIKWIDVAGIQNLDLQLEHNYARPYTYAHQNSYTSFTHYRQPLAHPLGANFKELVSVVRYQPAGRLQLTVRGILALQGEDNDSTNWGRNPLLPYATYEREYGNVTGQGIGTRLGLLNFQASYMLFHNLLIDCRITIRNEQQNGAAGPKNSTFAGIGLRLNTDTRHHYF